MGGIKGRKQRKRLQRRLVEFLTTGAYPTRFNPGKEGSQGTGHEMHKPGSNKK